MAKKKILVHDQLSFKQDEKLIGQIYQIKEDRRVAGSVIYESNQRPARSSGKGQGELANRIMVGSAPAIVEGTEFTGAAILVHGNEEIIINGRIQFQKKTKVLAGGGHTSENLDFPKRMEGLAMVNRKKITKKVYCMKSSEKTD